MREIIVDNFAGGGGASTGIEMAIGRSVDIAINHDENAVAMHSTNHPRTLHYCESVYDVNPRLATAGQRVGLAWFSPDCRHFSKAKGGKPVEKSIRGLAWIVIRWALEVRPRVMMLENVSEFQTWGPLLREMPVLTHAERLLLDLVGPPAPVEHTPDRSRAGETFAAFVGMLTTGINADHPALLECCHFLNIDPSSEQAMSLVNGLGYELDHRELRACDYGAPTIRKRFFMVMRCDKQPIVWPDATHGDPNSEAVKTGQLRPWRTAAECIDWSIKCPSIFERNKPLAANTLKRIARGIQRFVVDSASPFIVKCNHTSNKSNYDCFRGQSLAEPLQTITKTHGYAIAVPYLTKFRTGATGQELTEPAPTITAGSSVRPGGNGHALGLVEAELSPFISRQFGASIGHRIDEPSATITAGGGGKSQLVAANLVKHFGGNYTGAGVDLDGPSHTITTTDHHALVASHLIMMYSACPDGQTVEKPMPTVTAGGLHAGEVRTLLAAENYDEARADQVSAFLQEHGISEFVTIKNVVYRIVDIGMRMLQPHELYAAQGFPDWYIIDRDYRGVKYAKDKQVARCGNAVPPPFAESLVRANLPELCGIKEQAA
ncbi:DNA cytosine methyltransferase [Atlantibacter hermannii]|uniref:DNA cytosine methyltransferase n=1 Tax=Atlantibacter hermannii TaxID=565 RepID=UPI0028982E1C|nr:DNA cytosine methyltransferase [Atlantibacter hermannii]